MRSRYPDTDIDAQKHQNQTERSSSSFERLANKSGVAIVKSKSRILYRTPAEDFGVIAAHLYLRPSAHKPRCSQYIVKNSAWIRCTDANSRRRRGKRLCVHHKQ